MDSRIHLYHKNSDVLKILASAGADLDAVNKAGNTILTLAIVYGYDEVVKLLLEYGADANKKREYGKTPLMLASDRNLTVIVKLLLDSNADINEKDKYNRTALMHASNEGQIDVIKILIDYGAHLNTQDSDGQTALMYASSGSHGRHINMKTYQNGMFTGFADSSSGLCSLHMDNGVFLGFMHPSSGSTEDVVKLLIDYGADMNMKDDRGRTALDHASNEDIINLLKQAGTEE